jgi:hypothetical protein
MNGARLFPIVSSWATADTFRRSGPEEGRYVIALVNGKPMNGAGARLHCLLMGYGGHVPPLRSQGGAIRDRPRPWKANERCEASQDLAEDTRIDARWTISGFNHRRVLMATPTGPAWPLKASFVEVASNVPENLPAVPCDVTMIFPPAAFQVPV